ncbi:MAG: nucleotide exchange factor GrpE [Bacteroidia bacterium]|nr:nucleotide exchange factor GrpE [Bacteroidia bacterium]NNC85809.1 nucleotide exchange factor GrpE [Bacteroidia bacterium]
MSEKEIKDQELENQNAESSSDNLGSSEEHHDEEIAEHKEEDLVAKWEEEATLAKDKHLRLVAEFENFKKRTLKERIDLINTAGAEVITEMLPVLDDLERALKTMEESESTDKENLQGVKLIYNKLKSKLENKGLKPMDSMGKEFDDEHMDAITQIPVEKKKQKNKVMDVVEKGYFLNGKVIRHAKVVVGA